MSWKRHSTSIRADVEVSLDEFSDEQLLQGLVDSKLITEPEAESILRRASITGLFRDRLLEDEFSIALHEITVGRRHEAMIHLERALGREWIGRLA